MAHERAGLPAQESDLIDVDKVIAAYYDLVPDPNHPDQRVVFGTSGHRGSSLDTAFNEAHIAATTQAIVEYRAAQGTTGPLFIGKDTHALSMPAWKTAIEVLHAAGVEVLAEREDEYTPTPAVSRAIIRYNMDRRDALADGIVVTPSHNPPRDGGFKYNPPNGGPADTDATSVIAARANELLADFRSIGRQPYERISGEITRYDYRTPYCNELSLALNLDAIRGSGLRHGADPLGGASVQYWEFLAEQGLPIEVVNPLVDPTWRFMTLDTDGKIRMDCSSPNAMASLVQQRSAYSLATGNDADSDRHGIVTPDAGLMNPNAYLAVAINYLFANRPGWSPEAGVGKTLVSSSIIDKVAGKLGRRLVEVPVGFKWFVPGLTDGSIGFGGEESAGASFLTLAGKTWTTDKDGILLALLASEILAVTGKTPSQHYAELEAEFGRSFYARVDADADREQKARLSRLSAEDVTVTELAGEPITAILSHAPGNGAAIGGIKVTTEHAWFAARPSGTEDKYKIYAESLKGSEHLAEVQSAAKSLVDTALA
ncbi:phosphoglucomutase [Tessaracoccus bendigoensis DSM 12906]|uniref:Phosphoglucomutase n=1 Tax=Tessaracoccus bendigoensis DSM 12906 TaxID=1123357 RepID=A0A1M6CQI6_9ACTN|nr:phosphoglucomutase (alpha-D-glucose-1,6-bisphosphate-dependent) [Tessaracoccus bendigoensis]SHI63355.1 phosphoglucomutase [Tessaracoccus bendigoensis DSM 12906]